MLTFETLTFSELSLECLYELLALRSAIFVVEQQCPYQDLDGKDLQAMHLIGREHGKLCTYLRFFPPTEAEPSLNFGRVLSAPDVRQKGYARLTINELLSYARRHYQGVSITCSAQQYLIEFYQSFGFVVEGQPYDLDGIIHVDMVRGAN